MQISQIVYHNCTIIDKMGEKCRQLTVASTLKCAAIKVLRIKANNSKYNKDDNNRNARIG